MNNRHTVKRLCTVLLAGTVVFGMVAPGRPARVDAATSVQQKLDDATRSKKENLAKLNEAKEQKKSVLADKAVLDGEIDVLESELAGIDSIIADADQRIAEKQAEIDAYEQDIAANDEQFRQRLRAMDENNIGNYIDVLFKADSFSDFLARVETIREISEHDQAVIDRMVNLKNGVEQSKAVIEADKQEQVEARSLVADKKAALDAKVAQKNELIQSIENDVERLDQMYQEAAEEEQRLKDQIAASLSKSSSYAGGASGKTFVGGTFLWPLPSSSYITSPYGGREHPLQKVYKQHTGVDVAASTGAAVLAANGGTVTLAGWNGGYGYCVVIDHGGGMATLYGHNSSLLVSTGQQVSKGQQIARAGSTGNSTGPHLHFEVLVNGSTVNPMNYFN